MSTATAVVNSFPKDRDYRREAMQATPTSFTPTSEYRPASHLCSQSCFVLNLVFWFQDTTGYILHVVAHSEHTGAGPKRLLCV